MSGTEANAGQDPGLRSLVASVPIGGLVLVLVALAWWGEKLKQSPGETALENLLSDSPGFALFVFLPAMFLSLSVTIACLAMSTEVLVRRVSTRIEGCLKSRSAQS